MNEQVCSKNLILDRKNKKCIRERDLCKPYQLYNITTRQCEKVCKRNEIFNPRIKKCIGSKMHRGNEYEKYDYVKQKYVTIRKS